MSQEEKEVLREGIEGVSPRPTPAPVNPRVRFLYAKRGAACFLSHADLPVLFGRAARRAGLSVSLTQGFSPHPKVSLGPPLPVGVVGCGEPLEVWFDDWEPRAAGRFGAVLPPGFSLLGAEEVQGSSLASLCKAGAYRLFFHEPVDREGAAEDLRTCEAAAPCVRRVRPEGDGLSLVLLDPDRYGASHLVRWLAAAGRISGWGDLLVVRERLGGWNDETEEVLELMRPGTPDPSEEAVL